MGWKTQYANMLKRRKLYGSHPDLPRHLTSRRYFWQFRHLTSWQSSWSWSYFRQKPNTNIPHKWDTNEKIKLLVNALVISRVYYCNSTLYGLPKQEMEKLERIQNRTAAGLITGTKHKRIKPCFSRTTLAAIRMTHNSFLTITFKDL